jgi:hypothetical protein
LLDLLSQCSFQPECPYSDFYVDGRSLEKSESSFVSSEFIDTLRVHQRLMHHRQHLLEGWKFPTYHLRPLQSTLSASTSANSSPPDRLLQLLHMQTMVFPIRSPIASSLPASLILLSPIRLRLLPSLLSLHLPSPGLFLLLSLGKSSPSRKASCPSRSHLHSPASCIYQSRFASASTPTLSSMAITDFSYQESDPQRISSHGLHRE